MAVRIGAPSRVPVTVIVAVAAGSLFLAFFLWSPSNECPPDPCPSSSSSSLATGQSTSFAASSAATVTAAARAAAARAAGIAASFSKSASASTSAGSTNTGLRCPPPEASCPDCQKVVAAAAAACPKCFTKPKVSAGGEGGGTGSLARRKSRSLTQIGADDDMLAEEATGGGKSEVPFDLRGAECPGCPLDKPCEACAASCSNSPCPTAEAPWSIKHTHDCRQLANAFWVRRLCFEPLPIQPTRSQAAAPWLPEVTVMYLRVDKQPPLPGLPESAPGFREGVHWTPALESGKREWKPACGDTLRIQFYNSDTYFAPHKAVEEACGRWRLEVQAPPANASYSVRVKLIHVDGEGMMDPAIPLDWNANVMGNKTLLDMGPAVYNLDAKFQGHLAVRHLQNPGERDRGRPSSGEFLQSGEPLDYVIHLPLCKGGDTLGRWTRAPDPLHPPFLGEPLTWEPYTCRYVMHTSRSLYDCLSDGKHMTHFVGESILGQLFFLFTLMADGKNAREDKYPHGGYYWPPFEYEVHPGANQGIGEYLQLWEKHGLGFSLELIRMDPSIWRRPFLVVGVGHNDMMRRRFSEMEENLQEFISLMKENKFEGKLIWMTAPVRHYKAFGGQVADCACPNGRQQDCRGENRSLCACDCPKWQAWYPTDYNGNPQDIRQAFGVEPHPDEEFSWFGGNLEEAPHNDMHELPLMCNTYSRLRAANAMAVRVLKEALPPHQFAVLDFQTLTEPLPADFNFDGLHYGCFQMHVEERPKGPWNCKNLANRAIGNILANIICNS